MISVITFWLLELYSLFCDKIWLFGEITELFMSHTIIVKKNADFTAYSVHTKCSRFNLQLDCAYRNHWPRDLQRHHFNGPRPHFHGTTLSPSESGISSLDSWWAIALYSQVCSLWSNFSHFIFLPLFSFFPFSSFFRVLGVQLLLWISSSALSLILISFLFTWNMWHRRSFSLSCQQCSLGAPSALAFLDGSCFSSLNTDKSN